ncbi:MAG: oligopeptidase A [Gammaproteobacteria bacterium RBG_16_51_14]|nr:MAG: oligopeptidase A [Gammaproteobacteria bacterium RBG_16_51_14]
MDNPLLQIQDLPRFSEIRPEHIEPAIDQLLAQNRAQVAALLINPGHSTWENTIQPLEDLDDHLNRTWSPVNHLHSVADNIDLRIAYNNCLPKLSDYATDMGQNEALYRAFTQIAGSEEYNQLSAGQKKIIDNALRDFRLSGIHLDTARKQRYREIQQELSRLQTRFEENLLDATQAWKKLIINRDQLAGLPESSLALAAQTAKREGHDGWMFTLEFPSYMPVMQYAENEELRKEMYLAYVTRASDQGPHAGRWDNSEIMVTILDLRYQLARLLDYPSYAHYSLARKMARTPEDVMVFLDGLAGQSLPVAQKELAELKILARKHAGAGSLNIWDIAFYSEKLRQQKFDFSQEDLRPYFPVPQVLHGLFSVVNLLYGISIRERKGIDVWHPDVRFFDICDSDQALRGCFYLDLYARSHKRGGAWMDECIVRKKTCHRIQSPVAYLTCNFTPPLGENPALLTHDEVITLFHEFGHGLHHMLTRVDYPSVAGINGVPWDAVELPSQFMENWCWEREALDLFARHIITRGTLSNNLYEKMKSAKTFQGGMQMVRQLEFALFDFRLHLEYSSDNKVDIQSLLNEVRSRVAVVSHPDFNRFQHGFSHIFAGGYAAGYYSYKWAEVLSSDAFSKFEEKGIFDRETGQEFMHAILEQGGSRDPMELFIEFRGREPRIEPLLRHAGITTQEQL